MSTDQDIFDQATGKAPVEQTENVRETPTEAPVEAKEERVRDDKGRFASAAPEPISEVVPEVQPEPVVEPAEDRSDRIPSWRLKEEAEARREWQKRAEAAERERELFKQQMWQLQQAAQPKPELPDIFADPQGFISQMQQAQEAQLKQMRGEFSLARAGDKYGDETVQAAFQALQQAVAQGDTATHRSIVESTDPGRKLVEWYKREQTMHSIGDGGIEAYRQRILDEALKDPDYQAKAIEAFKATQAKPNNQVRIPPSLSHASAARSSHDESVGGSGADMYAFATRKTK